MKTIKTVTYEEFRALAIEELSDIATIPINKFNSYFNEILKRILPADSIFDIKITEFTNEDGYKFFILPRDTEFLLDLIDKNIGKLYSTDNIEIVKYTENRYMKNKLHVYVHNSIKDLTLKYQSNIQSAEDILLPNHDQVLKALIYGILWRKLYVDFYFKHIGNVNEVKAAKLMFDEFTTSFKDEKGILEVKSVHKIDYNR